VLYHQIWFFAALFSFLISPVYAGGGSPAAVPTHPNGSCNPVGYLTPAVGNDGQPVTNFNGYWDMNSRVEILNADGRKELFWLDDGGKIRHQTATARCNGAIWGAHYDFEDGYAKELVVARDSDGRIVVAHIGRDNALYWRSQLSPGNLYTGGWNRLAILWGFSSLSAKIQSFQAPASDSYSQLNYEVRSGGTGGYKQLIFELRSGGTGTFAYQLYLDKNNSKAVLCDAGKLWVPARGMFAFDAYCKN